jgi:hypothetical protein
MALVATAEGGYRRQRKAYRLKFEQYPGLEVMAESVSVRQLLRVMRMADELGASPTEEQVTGLFGVFAERVRSWTLLDEDGEPVPPGLDALLDEDFEFALTLVLAWVQAISSVTAPLATTSGANTAATPPEAELDLPMSPPEQG